MIPVLRTFATAGAPRPRGPNCGVRGRRGGQHRRLAEHMERHVEHVHADVHQRAAAGGGPPGEPAAQRGDPLAAQPAGLGVVDLAEHSGVDDRLQLLDVTSVAVVERHVEHPVVALSCLHHLPRLRRVLGHRLLRQHVQPGVEGGDHGGVVQRRRGGHADHVQLAMADQVRPVGELPVPGDAVPVAERRPADPAPDRPGRPDRHRPARRTRPCAAARPSPGRPRRRAGYAAVPLLADRAPSRTPGTPTCWPTCCAPTDTG